MCWLTTNILFWQTIEFSISQIGVWYVFEYSSIKEAVGTIMTIMWLQNMDKILFLQMWLDDLQLTAVVHGHIWSRKSAVGLCKLCLEESE